ncbi:hypothetical protein E2C01_059356 [Portunus trituberculatus]|uniref:Uncharacterized protein n=1 Tax=Portunus trituberculatus TaxID=210409 RepID=A0A5B7H8V5_PORTR|nr:hypothetical protein [Portunus trituberculatus]
MSGQRGSEGRISILYVHGWPCDPRKMAPSLSVPLVAAPGGTINSSFTGSTTKPPPRPCYPWLPVPLTLSHMTQLNLPSRCVYTAGHLPPFPSSPSSPSSPSHPPAFLLFSLFREAPTPTAIVHQQRHLCCRGPNA